MLKLSRLQISREIIDKSITKYISQIESADRQDTQSSKLKTERLEKKILRLKNEVKRLNDIEEALEATPDKQISLTDSDARSMKTRGSGIVGYNVQAAVDTKNHIILAHDVTNIGADKGQLFNVSKQAQSVIDSNNLRVIADRGYYNAEQIIACERSNITTFLPKPQTSGNQAKGLYGKRDFIYDPERDVYTCPNNEIAIYRFSSEEKGKTIRRYWSSSCINCSLKSQCTTGKHRRISRTENENILDDVEARLELENDMMKIRRSTVEHPFGTIKSWMGATHFHMKTLKNVQTEMSLHILAYNIKRVINIIGAVSLINMMKT